MAYVAVAFLLISACWFFAVGLAQSPPQPLTCDQQLAQTQARYDLVSIGREQSEQVAAQALAGLRTQLAETHAKLKDAESKRDEMDVKLKDALEKLKAVESTN